MRPSTSFQGVYQVAALANCCQTPFTILMV
jgi:hypothetical protein